ncbi:two-component system sporulation sensor kinase B [Scopulibacillus daqui]|uniref:histidine kinase n=1 Tax=Scopulibacillus daqui TaxID=1469162 RepID=A0ABS2PY70_9BACL|nr:sensor histidine kinase [Scopulibacillus daqui]MBM7644434.1 two-component system sporulation sensor kinase B [Scopulibacillus daqui]
MFVEFCIQIFLVLTILSLYLAWTRLHPRLTKKKLVFLFFFNSLIIILCMSFPVTYHSDPIINLRVIPWIVSFLYGGLSVGIPVTLVMVIYELFDSQMGIGYAVILYTMMLIFILLIKNRFENNSYFNKLKCTTCIILLYDAFTLFVIYINHRELLINSKWLIAAIVIIPVLANWLVIFLIEAIQANDKFRLEMARSEKIHIVGQLAASVAHEVRNPITVVKGFMQLIQHDEKLSGRYHDYLQTMERELDRATGIINDYLSLAKPQEGQAKIINITEQLHTVCHTLHSYAVINDMRLNCRVKESYYVKGSIEKTQQLLVNIIKNGIEASPKESVIDLDILKEKKHILIKIRDYGQGMTRDQIEKAGMPFYTTKESGTGLGLMVCYQIVESMNGKIHIESEPSKGTCFTIKLPIYKG